MLFYRACTFFVTLFVILAARYRGHVFSAYRAVGWRGVFVGTVLGLELLSKVGEREHPRHDDDEAEEYDGIVETGREHGTGDQVEEPQDDDLLVVGGCFPMREAGDLEEGRVLDAHAQHRLP